MENRQEYFKNYYKEHKNSIIKRSKKNYESNKKECLTYARTYYILNRDRILLMAKLRDTTKSGHAHAIWKATAKYAKKWGIPSIPWTEFKTWAMTDDEYDRIYQQWKESEFDRTYGPVIIRGVKKNGFVPENLKWDYREQYSWWSTEMEGLKKQEEDLNKQQLERNKRTKEWRAKVRAEWKAKQKK